MKALVLTFDRNAVMTEHMIARYNTCWPDHPFTFCIPYQSEARRAVNWGGSSRAWIHAPDASIQGTMDALLADLDPDEWVYWAIDDKYPEQLDVKRLAQLVARLPETQLDAILPCRTRRMLKPEMLGEAMKLGNEQLIVRKTWHQIWIHQFLRPRVLRHLFAGMPQEIPEARAMDKFKFDIPMIHRLVVLERNAARFGESLSAGEVLLNTLESIRSIGQPQPIHLPANTRKAVWMGSPLPLSIRSRLERLLQKLSVRLLRWRLGTRRFQVINKHPAGWEIYAVMKAAKPHGDVHFFDIGCNDGLSTAAYARWFPRATGVLFEAHPDIATIARDGLKTVGLADKFAVVSCALGNANEVMPLHVSTAASTGRLTSKGTRPKASKTDVVMDSSSLLPPSEHEVHYPCVKFEKTMDVPVRRADDLISEQGRLPDFLHMDVQGAELQVLEGFGERLAEVSAVWMEVSRAPLYPGAPGVQEVADWMQAAGFNCWLHAVGKVDGNQLWVRRDLPHNARQLKALRHHRLRSRTNK